MFSWFTETADSADDVCIVVQVSAIYHYQRGAELESKKPIKLSLKQIFAFLLELSD